VPPAQRCQRAGHGRSYRCLRAGRRDPAAVADDLVPGRAAQQPDRADPGAGATGMTWSRRQGDWRDEDPELFAIIDRELERQNTTIQLIASEHFTSPRCWPPPARS